MQEDRMRIGASPWHAGERTMQALIGVAERMEQVGRRVIRDFMPDQHRAFYASQSSIVIGAVDPAGRAWATWLEGAPGFMTSPDPRRLELAGLPAPGDPTRAGLAEGAAVGLLGIELSTRRRNRLNGQVRDRRPNGFAVEVEQSFGNCPQYITRREPDAATDAADPAADLVETLSALDGDAQALIRAADTAFVASHVDPPDGGRRRSVDVSHRGGRPGFIRVEGDRLTIPEYPGNRHFNTLGNLLVNPRAGLLFVDFESGDVLQLSGSTRFLLGPPELDRFQGAERIWRFDVEAAVRRRAVLRMRMRRAGAPGQTAATGTRAGIDDAKRVASDTAPRWPTPAAARPAPPERS
ncbi:MAG: pyridoxamine 5'-phosphate oxidase family protein [Myxococcota bacterium]